MASPHGKQIYEVLGLGFGEKLKEQLNLGLDDVQQMVIAFRGVAPDVKVSSAYFKFRKSPMLDAARLAVRPSPLASARQSRSQALV